MPILIGFIAIIRNYYRSLLTLLAVLMRLDMLALLGSSSCTLYKVIMSLVYAAEGSSGLAHHQAAYATHDTLLHHTSCYGPSFAQAFRTACGSFTRVRVLIIAP